MLFGTPFMHGGDLRDCVALWPCLFGCAEYRQ